MRICLDGYSISQLQGTGLYSYTYLLLSGLLDKYPQPEYSLVWPSGPAPLEWKEYSNLSYFRGDINRFANDFSLLAEYLTNTKVDLFHSPNNGFSNPANKNCKYIVTVHDLAPVSSKEYADDKYIKKFTEVFPASVEKADGIIAVSDFIKKELITYYKIPDKKITVIHPWCAAAFKRIEKQAAKELLETTYKVNGKYLLYAGSIHPRKNLDVLLKALKLLKKEMPEFSLVLVGNTENKRKGYADFLKSLSKELDIENQVHFIGLVPYRDMPYFYAGAECAINLSSYDGFPLTALEAAACSCPLICTRKSFFEEAVADYPVYVDTIEVELIKDRLSFLLEKSNRNRTDFVVNKENGILQTVSLYEKVIYG